MSRFFIPIFLVVAMILLLSAQCTIMFRWILWDVRMELLPALLLYAAFTVNLPVSLILGLLAAIMYDSFSGGNFGASAVPYVVSTAFFCMIRPVFFRNRMTTQFISGFIFAWIALPIQWLLAGKFMVSWNVVFPKLMHLTLFCGLLAVLYFTVFDFFFRLVGLNPGRFEDDLE